MNKNKKVGRWGESIAAAYLEGKGYSIVDRNYSTPEGEIDLIAVLKENGEEILVFIEVKTRTSEKYGYPEEAITLRKWGRMLKAIERYMVDKSGYEGAWQIDEIAVQRLLESGPPDIDHFENVVMSHDRE